MALNKITLASAINTALTSTTWASCANQLANAIDEFILSGDVITDITATNYPPGGGSTIIYGKAAGDVTTSAKAGLVSAGTTAFASTLWATVAGTLCPAINTLLSTATVATEPTTELWVGSGSGTVTPTGYTALYDAFNAAFTTTLSTKTWELISNDLADAVDAFVRSATVTTTDSGTYPLTTWSGSGIGGIT